MFTAFLIKYAEIGVKGRNRYLFEDALVHQIKYALKRCEGSFLVHKKQGRIYVDAQGEFDFDETVECLKHVFGISGICPVVYVEDEGFERLCDTVVGYVAEVYPGCNKTFKVNAKRSDKSFPMKSPEICRELGGLLLERFPHLRVDVEHPQVTVTVEDMGFGEIFPSSGKGWTQTIVV